MLTAETVINYNEYKLVVCGNPIGFRCGFVGVSADHPLYKLCSDSPSKYLMDFKDIPIEKRNIINLLCDRFDYDKTLSPSSYFSVHGGMNFSNYKINLDPNIKANNKYHEEVNNNNWWYFGFDCGHWNDAKDITLITDRQLKAMSMYMDQIFGIKAMGIIRTNEYVLEECKSLADQLQEVNINVKNMINQVPITNAKDADDISK